MQKEFPWKIILQPKVGDLKKQNKIGQAVVSPILRYRPSQSIEGDVLCQARLDYRASGLPKNPD